jgi:hypothetical protein
MSHEAEQRRKAPTTDGPWQPTAQPTKGRPLGQLPQIAGPSKDPPKTDLKPPPAGGSGSVWRGRLVGRGSRRSTRPVRHAAMGTAWCGWVWVVCALLRLVCVGDAGGVDGGGVGGPVP